MKIIKSASVILVGFILVTITLVSGCLPFDIDTPSRETITGSSVVTDYLLDYSGFSELTVAGPIRTEITRASIYKVSLSVNENVLHYVQINQIVNVLRINLDPSVNYRNVDIVLTIGLPDLRTLGISAAGTCTLNGFNLEEDMEISVSGASTLKMQNINTEYASLAATGASNIIGDLISEEARVSVSGASTINLSGQCIHMFIEVSGASQLKMSDFWVNKANVIASGVSGVDINVGGSLDITLSGVSSMTYGGNPKLGTVRVDALSTLRRR